MPDVVLVKDFLSLVGSAVERSEEAHDIDVLFRADYDDGRLSIPAESAILAVRDAARELTGRHDLDVHPIFNPTGPHHGTAIPIADLVIRWNQCPTPVQIKSSLPKGWPPKPSVAFYTEHFSPDELWEKWGERRAPFAVEPKLNGWRTLVVRRGDQVSVYFEDGEDHADKLSPLVRRIMALDVESVTLDGDLGIRDKNGRRWPRKDLPAILSGDLDWSECEPVLVAFDILELNGRDLRDLPFKERRSILLDVAPGLAVPQRVVRNLTELRRAYAAFSNLDQSEGIVAKTLDAPYPDGPTSEWSKVKNRLEVKARVVQRRVLKNGMFVYLCEWSDGSYTGWTMPTRIAADVGDVLTVAVHEINVTSSGVTWQNGSVIDVDPNGRPYTPEQAVSLASRYLRTFRATEKGSAVRQLLPFHVPGSKRKIAKKIAAVIASQSYSVYVEPFAGSAAVLLALPRREGVTEVLNDLDERKVRALRFLARCSDKELEEALEKVRSIPVTRESFDRVASMVPENDRQAFVQLRYLTATGRRYADSLPGHLVVRSSMATQLNATPDSFRDARERLAGVKFSSEDAIRCIQRWDSPDTMFYIDPPYPASDAGYRRGYTPEDFHKLIETLKKIKGHFVLSCRAEDLRVSGVKLPSTWRVRRIRALYSMPRETRMSYELLITNFGLAKKATRSEASEEAWERSWHSWYPKQGTGKFVAQYHWRGLSEDELDLPAEELDRRGRSVHLDLRFTIGGQEDGLWGITVFRDGEEMPLDKLLSGEPVRSAPKQWEPYEWLTVADREPYVAKPGQVGATSRSYARIDRVDGGTYSAGTWNRHAAEFVLDGQRLRGRFLLRRIAPGAWTLERADGPPIAARESSEAIAERLRQRGHELFIYRDPEGQSAPRVVRIKGEISIPHLAADTMRRFLWALGRLLRRRRKGYIMTKDGRFIVLVATNTLRDADGEVVTREAIASALENPPPATIRLNHIPGTDFADIVYYLFVPSAGTLIAIARIREDKVSRRIAEFLQRHPYGHPEIAPLGWATSVRFVGRKAPGGEITSMRIQEVSILPVERASNLFTFLTEEG